jgi:plasmid stabilization system protein ParE
MNIEILEIAQKELDDAVLYYELEQPGLGSRFKEAVRQSIDRIKKYPTSWPIERGEVRKFFVHKFPYKILYSIQKQKIVILAVAHQHRKPGYWIERLENIT